MQLPNLRRRLPSFGKPKPLLLGLETGHCSPLLQHAQPSLTEAKLTWRSILFWSKRASRQTAWRIAVISIISPGHCNQRNCGPSTHLPALSFNTRASRRCPLKISLLRIPLEYIILPPELLLLEHLRICFFLIKLIIKKKDAGIRTMRTEPFLYLLSSAPSNDDELYTSPDLKDNHSDHRMIVYIVIFFSI